MARTTQRDAELDRLLAEIDRLRREVNQIQSEPEDDFETGSIVTWDRQFQDNGTVYTYVAVKFHDVRWALSGRSDAYYNWRDLYRTHIRHAMPGSVHWASELTPTEWQP